MTTKGLSSKASERWWTPETLAIVTGGNKGIGYGITKIFSEEGLRTVVAARNADLGKEAVRKLESETGSSNIFFAQLDISDPASVDEFGKLVEGQLGAPSILVNNAGIAFKGNAFGAKEAQQTLDVNYHGTKAVCERMTPLMAPGARIVNVCSMAGKQRILKSPHLTQRFQEASTPEDTDMLAKEFVEAINNGTYQKQGWPSSMYGVSKLCEATYTRILAQQLAPKGVSVYACCPGYVSTDMSSHKGTKTIREGADTPAWLALLAPASASGGFFSECTEEAY